MRRDAKGRFWMNDALDFHHLSHQSFREWLADRNVSDEEVDEDTLRAYINALYDSGPLEKLLLQMVEEIFFLMFMNREFLRKYHEMVSSCVKTAELDLLSKSDCDHFASDGVLKRSHIPMWAQRAVFYRDRGACAICMTDLTGIVCIGNRKHFDHMVALQNGGVNCVTNLQLLCETCNLSKGADSSVTSTKYESWY
ncbi:MAG: HNH endonuclease [Planctomyces sp.]|nr:HNH endonuclease [Planctomyces sp.]